MTRVSKKTADIAARVETIHAMLTNGATTKDICAAVGVCKTTVDYTRRRLARQGLLKAVETVKAKRVSVDLWAREDGIRTSVPAGHPATWGLISDVPFQVTV